MKEHKYKIYITILPAFITINLISFDVEFGIGQITKYVSRLYSNEDLFEFKISAFDKCIKGGMCL
jgi:uncharacterized membrane protein